MDDIGGNTGLQDIVKGVVQYLVGGVDSSQAALGIHRVDGAFTGVDTADGVSHHHVVRVACSR